MDEVKGTRYELQTEHTTSFDAGITTTKFWTMVEWHEHLQSAQVNLAKYALATGKRFRIKNRITGEIL